MATDGPATESLIEVDESASVPVRFAQVFRSSLTYLGIRTFGVGLAGLVILLVLIPPVGAGYLAGAYAVRIAPSWTFPRLVGVIVGVSVVAVVGVVALSLATACVQEFVVGSGGDSDGD